VKLTFLAFLTILSSSDEESEDFSLRFDFLSDLCLAGLLLRDGEDDVAFFRAMTLRQKMRHYNIDPGP